ncbi:unnamed protein product [Lepeophtheirus salmonis]|uniref:(salmon louse) hypothetical protein n=1 Tax=Lepeophtheirus salmonis TaxID=72036 RepID=A0A817FCW6_LEPSM|nr:unnamed protein product [Lepeophtheirus salmonis]
MDHIESQTCVRFVKTDRKTKKNTLLINGENQCSSTVGYAAQPIDYWDAILSLNVTTCLQFGIIVHELMHGIGSLHEQSRPDRNEFIQVEWNNIRYWGRNQFYNSPLKVVSPEVEIGQRTAMSPLDVEKVNEMFKCPSKEEKCTTQSGNCTFPFKYGGVTYGICTNDYAYYSWCATQTSGKEHDYIRGHWDYCPKSCFMNYIAVVKTSFEPVLSDGVVPICLPTNSSHYYEGRAATYTYVNNKTETKRSNQIQKFGILKVVSNDGFGLKKENKKIVAKRGFQFDANQIVSGPLVMKENGNCTVIGISSKLNVSETNSNISDEISFTRVDQYLDWIEESIIKLLEQ